MNPEFDALLEAYFNTISMPERADVVTRIVNHMTGQVIWMSMFHRVDVSMLPNRVLNAEAKGEDSTQGWNANEWDLRQD